MRNFPCKSVSRAKFSMLQLAEDKDAQEDMGDIDLWSLSPDGNSLVVNGRWLNHLQQRMLGQDGQPKKTKVGQAVWDD